VSEVRSAEFVSGRLGGPPADRATQRTRRAAQLGAPLARL